MFVLHSQFARALCSAFLFALIVVGSVGVGIASAAEPQPVFINIHPLQNRLIIPFSIVAKDYPKLSAKEHADLKGWFHVYQLLVREGVDPEYLSRIFRDSRMPPNRPLFFSLNPKESRAPYRRRNNQQERKNATRFYQKHAEFFEQAEKQFNIPQAVILAILQIETRCGGYTGGARIFKGLARLASASDPKNIQRNFRVKSQQDKSVTLAKVSARAHWLERTFLPHAVASIVLAARKDIHPLDLKGSGAGAIGFPQFLPGNYFAYGVDANNDGSIDLFSPPDAIMSVASFLKAHGWSALDISPEERQKVIWNYNRSAPYVETVLAMANALEKDIEKLRKTALPNKS